MQVADILFPEKCIFCGKLLSSDENGYCIGCGHRLSYVTEPVCMRCGKPVADAETEYCSNCEMNIFPALDKGAAVWVYDEVTKPAMADFKYGGCAEDAAVYADEICSAQYDFIQKCKPDAIVPVPIHKKRFRFRGYNQAERLATEIGKRIGIPVLPLIKRTLYTQPLKKLSATERKKSLLSAFEADEKLCREQIPANVILVDDIYTTGSTVEVCARVLKSIGVKNVYAIYICIGKDF